LTLVVWGARRVGKSALLGALRDRLVEDGREDALAVPLGEPLLDWLPLSLGPIGEWHVHLDLYAVAGGTHHEVTRRVVLRDTDGILAVVDSQAARLDDNLDAIRALERGLTERGDVPVPPRVWCYSKQDLPADLILPPARLNAQFNQQGEPAFGADLVRGS